MRVTSCEPYPFSAQLLRIAIPCSWLVGLIACQTPLIVTHEAPIASPPIRPPIVTPDTHPFAPTRTKSPIPTTVSVAGTKPSAQPVLLPTSATSPSLPTVVAPALKDSASMHIGKVIPLGEGVFPFGLAFAGRSLWVLIRQTNFRPPGYILQIDPVRGQIAGEPIQFDFDPWSFAVTEEAIWVAKNGPQKVLRIDPVTGQVVASLDINAMLVAADENGAWISSGEYDDSTVYQIDQNTNRVVGDPIPVGVEPIQMVAGVGAVWVGAHSGPPAITRIDPITGKAAATIEAGFPVHGLAVGPDSVWAADYHDHKVVRISTQTNQMVGEPILLPFPPYAMSGPASPGSAMRRIQKTTGSCASICARTRSWIPYT